MGYAGRLVRKKGVDVLLNALALLSGRLPGVRLVVVGDGPERPALERLAATLGVAGAVTFVGHRVQDQMEGALAGVWVQAVPSRWDEPFGLVAAEAMMRGTAVVASSGGGLADQVVPGQTGALVPPGNAQALADALEPMLRDRDLAERMGAAGRARALAELTIDRHVDRMLTIYEDVLRTRQQSLATTSSTLGSS